MQKEAPKTKLDRRLVYILPSVLALCISLTTCVAVFRGYVIDLQNTSYSIFLEADQSNAALDTDTKCLEIINRVMGENQVSGFTVKKNLEGAFIDESGALQTQTSYEVTLMKIESSKANQIIVALREAFGTDVVLVQETKVVSYYVTAKGVAETAQEALGN